MPPVLEPPQVRPSTRYRRHTWRHRMGLGLMRLTILGAICGVIGGGYYLARRGFGREWRYRVVEELHKRGVEADIGRLTLDPFRGLVARNVRIFDYKNRENTLAVISEVSLDINYAALIHRQPFLNALDVRDAQIRLPLRTAEGKADKAQLTNFRAHVYFPPEQIYVSQAQGIFCGIRISATGQLIKRENYQPSPPISPDEWQRRLSIAQRVVYELEKFRFPAALPSLQLKFRPDGFRPDIIGHATFGQFSYKTVPFSDLTADFSWDGQRTFVRDLRVHHQTGQLRADLLDALNDFRINIESTISPGALRGLVPRELNEFLRDWEWQRSPAIRLAIRGKDRNPGSWQGDGNIVLGRSLFRGTWMNSANTRIHFADGALTCQDLHVARDEGIGTGSFTYDFKKQEVRVSNIRSSLNPAEVIFWIDPKVSKTVAPYKFRRPPNVIANGVYQFRGGKNTRLEVNVDGANGMDYVFLGKTLPFDHISARLLFTYDRLQITEVRVGLLAGTLHGNADISLARNDPRYHASLAVNGINFPLLTDLYYNYKTAQGVLSGTYDFTGLGTDWRTMRGRGKVEVSNGNVFAIPVFGPLSGILNRIVPGSGYSIAHEATANFKIENGIIHTDDFDAAGALLNMLGHGDIHFLDDKLDFSVRLNMKGPGVVLTPMYKLFEYAGTGSLKKPDWHPKVF